MTRETWLVADPNAAHVVAVAIELARPAGTGAVVVVGTAVGDNRTGHDAADDCHGAPTTELGVGVGGGRDQAGGNGDDSKCRNGEGLTHDLSPIELGHNGRLIIGREPLGGGSKGVKDFRGAVEKGRDRGKTMVKPARRAVSHAVEPENQEDCAHTGAIRPRDRP